jgi:hypothetical protein
MNKFNIKLAPSSHSNALVDESTLSLLQAMGAEGRFSADCSQIQDKREIVVSLNQHEINMLRIILIRTTGQITTADGGWQTAVGGPP